MAKLDKFINIQEENTIDVNKFGMKEMFEISKGSMDRAELLSMNNICGRYMNEYIIDPHKTRALVSSIRKNGLLQPIIVLKINDWLPFCASGEEKKYLEERRKQGFIYFVVAGHRRFRAVASLLSGELIESEEDLENFYKTLKDPSSDLCRKFEVKLGKKTSEKYTQILAIIADPSEIKEQDVYNDSNITSRSPSQFEIVISVYNQLSRNGELQNIQEKYCFSKKEKLPTALKRFILEKYAIDIDKSNIAKALRISEIMDPRILKNIYDGKLSVLDANRLLSIYQDIIDSDDLENLLNDIKENNFRFSDWKNRYSVSEKNITSDIKMSRKDIRNLLVSIKNGDLSLDDAIRMFSEV